MAGQPDDCTYVVETEQKGQTMSNDQTQNGALSATLCIYCDNEVGLATKPEHILLDALGGRKTTKWAVCCNCNQTFGGTIDKVIPEQLRVLRNMFQMHSGSGDPPPGLPKVNTLSGFVNFNSDGVPRPIGGKPFTVIPNGNGSWDLSFNVENEEQLRKYIPHAAAAIGISEEHLWAQIEGREASLRTSYVGPVHSALSCGGQDAVRSMTKSSLALLATVIGTSPLRGPAFGLARNFVVEGSADFLEHCTAMDKRRFPSPTYDRLIEDYGPMFNLIYVKSDRQGCTLAYFHLFNLFSWQIILAPTGGPANLEIALASNPLDPAQWDDEVAEKAPLTFEWLDGPDYTDGIETTLQRFSVILELYQELSQKRTVRKAITEVLGDHYAEGDRIGMDERGKAAFTALGGRLTTTLMQVPTEEKFILTRPGPSEKPSIDGEF